MFSRGLRVLAVGAVLAALGASVAGSSATAQVDDTCRVADKGSTVVSLRYGGKDRYAMAVCVSRSTWADSIDPYAKDESRANAVVLARGDLFPDALAGGPLAAHVRAPLLLTGSTSLHPDVRAEILRILPANQNKTVYLLGGTGSLSPGVESTIRSLGYVPKRLGGADRFQVAIRIAEELPVTSRFFITNGIIFPDALAAGSAAAFLNRGGEETWALLFTNDTTVPASTRAFATQRRDQLGGWTLITVGGAADKAGKAAFGSVSESIVGRNRYDGAAMVAQRFYVGADGNLLGEGVGLASGTTFPDALSGSATLAGYGEPLLLTTATSLPAETRAFLQQVAGKTPGLDEDPVTGTLDVFGGPGSVSESVRIAAKTAYTAG